MADADTGSRARRLTPLIPVVLGFLSAGVLAVADTGVSVQLRARPAGLALTVGILASLAWLAITLLQRRQRQRLTSAVAEATDAERSRAREEHRQFLSRLDHELKNPVTAIRAAVAARAETGDEHLRTVDTQATRLAAVVTDLRKLAELQTSPLELEPVDLAELVEEVVSVVRDELAVAGEQRELRVQFPAAPWRVPRVTGDSDLLFLAVYNVVSNARKFTGPGDLVEVRASEGEGHVDVDVADTGPGIPADEVHTVWEELSRASNARAVPGSGLGMSMVRTVIERHGGTVSLRSRLGEGTSVRLRLPTSG